MIIRKATPADRDSIVAFNQAMAHETENKTLPEDKIVPGVSRVLNDENLGFYLVAEVDNIIVGSLMVTYEWSDWRNGTFFWVQSVYVLPEHRRTGVYSALYKQVIALADQREDVCGYRLYVEKENEIAQKTYESLGMQETHYLMYENIS